MNPEHLATQTSSSHNIIWKDIVFTAPGDFYQFQLNVIQNAVYYAKAPTCGTVFLGLAFWVHGGTEV